MADTIRVAIIGATGRGEYGHGIDTVWKAIPRVEVVALADADEKGRAAAVKRSGAKTGYADYREMLAKEKPAIVGIGPRWIDQHLEMITACMEAGCHIYMEKPFCRTLEEADQIVRLSEMTHKKLAIAHQTRYSPSVTAVQKLISAGHLGKVLEIRARGKEDGRGGAEDLWVLGSHMMNLMQVFAGAPEWCFATVANAGHPITKADIVTGKEGLGPLAGDHIQAMYGFKDGVTGYWASRRSQAGSPSRFGLQIFGSKGVVEHLSGYQEEVNFLPDSSWSPGRSGKGWVKVTSAGIDQPEPLKTHGLHDGNVAAVNDLLDAIEQNREPLCNVQDARATIEMILAIFESQRLGKPVTMPLENRKHPLTML